MSNIDQALHFCEGCDFGKQYETSYTPTNKKERSSILGAFFHFDIVALCKNNQSEVHVIIFCSKMIAQDIDLSIVSKKLEALSCFKTLIKTVHKEFKCIVMTLKTNRSGKFCNKEFKQLLVAENIIHETNMSYTPQQNGYIVRDNGKVAEVACNMFYVKALPLCLWGEAIHIIVYIFNRTNPTRLGDKTPYEIWHGIKAIASHYWVFDYFSYVFINKQRCSKLDVKSSKLVFVGYNTTSKGYKLWEPNTKKVKESVDVTFDETSTYNNFAPKPTHFIKLLQVRI